MVALAKRFQLKPGTAQHVIFGGRRDEGSDGKIKANMAGR